MISQFSIPVEDLLPEVKNSTSVERPDNLEATLPNLIKEVESRPWLKQFFDDVRHDRRRAVFWLTVGSIVVTAATYELGVAHGRDVKELVALLGKRRPSSVDRRDLAQPDDGAQPA